MDDEIEFMFVPMGESIDDLLASGQHGEALMALLNALGICMAIPAREVGEEIDIEELSHMIVGSESAIDRILLELGEDYTVLVPPTCQAESEEITH